MYYYRLNVYAPPNTYVKTLLLWEKIKIIMRAEPSWTGSVLDPLCCHLRTQREDGSLQSRREPSPDHADAFISDLQPPKL